jgi:uncharacterized protein YdeI (YjbR/CyaY-like superfamily)
MDMTFFTSPARLRQWLQKHHDRTDELWIGFYKKASGKGGITYHEALDQALCFGWIDGVRKRVDDDCFMQRFTPRSAKSHWSHVNIRRVGELQAQGLMHAAGVAAFEKRDAKKTGRASYENAPRELDPTLEQRFKANKSAWTFFQAQPPSYRRTCTWWIASAVKEETRLRRLDLLMADCAKQRRMDLLAPRKKKD